MVQASTEGFQYKLQLVDDIHNVIREEYAYNRGMHIESSTVATRPEQALQRQGSDSTRLAL